MPRFLAQRDGYSCGPIAIINACKWAKHLKPNWTGYTGADIPKLRGLCETTKEQGTTIPCMIATLKNLGLSVSVKYKVRAKDILRSLNRGEAVIIVSYGFGKGEDEGHWFLLTQVEEDIFTAVNYRSGESTSKINRDELMNGLRKRGNGVDKPTAIVVKR
jgi:hypothetical protein